jgi:hypothetical protein
LRSELLDTGTGKRSDLLVFAALRQEWEDFYVKFPRPR